jgi:hypothetical protein
MKKKLRTIQPPHPSEKFTLEEAMEAWGRVEARASSRPARRSGSAAAHSAKTLVLKPSSPPRARVAAERDAAP